MEDGIAFGVWEGGDEGLQVGGEVACERCWFGLRFGDGRRSYCCCCCGGGRRRGLLFLLLVLRNSMHRILPIPFPQLLPVLQRLMQEYMRAPLMLLQQVHIILHCWHFLTFPIVVVVVAI